MLKLTATDIKNINNGDMTENLYIRAFDHLSNHGEMPYGIQKARTGDPREFVFNYLSNQIKKA